MTAATPPAVDSGLPLVSVITPCFTHAHYLAEALHSALAQDYARVELLVVNDGSPQGDIIDAVIASIPHDVVYIRQENQGIGAARNAALAHARGEFIQFLDADDRLLPNAVREGVTAFARHPECAMVWGFRRTINARGEMMYDKVGMRSHQPRYADLLETNIVGPPVSVMVRRDPLLEIGGFATEPCVEDYDMYLRIAARHPIHCHEQVVAEYRLHENNLSRDDALMLRGVLRVLGLQQQHIGDDRALRRAVRRGRSDARRRYHWEPEIERVRHHVRAGEWTHAVRRAVPLAIRYPLLFSGAMLRPLDRLWR